MKSFNYVKATTLEEASNILIENGAKATILNGGTDLLVRLRENLIQPEAIVDIKGIPELKDTYYDENTGLTIGAMTTMNGLGEIKEIQENYAFLADAAHTVGSLQIRNRATLTGNICNASPLADTATSLLVLEAKVNTYHAKNGRRSIAIHEFFTGPRTNTLEMGEIVTSITIPPTKGKGIYIKNARREEVDLSTVGVAVFKEDNGQFRIALGAVAATPIRAYKAEEIISNQEVTEDRIEQAAKVARETATPITDIRASKEYRSEMVEVMTRRAIKKLIEA
ncbi:xanthine dehydrogenase family protein subunit M [Irregularibacter muris]|uniref:Xanthine dehydrogenase family protein subunit M n=1 Tax=Irregularibacter muris TaxID=1796619 RepID=A0AAE3HCM5_9FIRM|nr:xanthine dehydrogenase family protein subunit M [Irregularibacter muris]MCR1897730.1 xanthine dehydrogenase family protein subunit M [Irregularibacter muris]